MHILCLRENNKIIVFESKSWRGNNNVYVSLKKNVYNNLIRKYTHNTNIIVTS